MKQPFEDMFYILLLTEKQKQDPILRSELEYREEWLLRPCIKIEDAFFDIYTYENYTRNAKKQFRIHDIFTYYEFSENNNFTREQKSKIFKNSSSTTNKKVFIFEIPTIKELEPYLENILNFYQNQKKQKTKKSKIFQIK